MELLDLPVEVLATLCLKLPGKDLANLAQTCRRFKEVVGSDFIWQRRCVEEFRFPGGSAWNGSFRDIYSKVLHKYGYLLGVWEDCTNCYGGLLHIWYTDDGRILSEELFSPKDVTCKLMRKPLFQITMTTDSKVEVTWVVPTLYGGKATSCFIKKTDSDDGDENKLQVEVTWDLNIESDQELERQAQKVLKEECLAKGADLELYLYKWKTIKQQSKIILKRHKPASRCQPDQVPIQPGLFKALYGGHGSEIIHVRYENDHKDFIGKKVAGDPNVPAHQVSVQANVRRPVNAQDFELGQIWSTHEKTEESVELESFSRDSLQRQQLILPVEVDLRGEGAMPESCLARYHCLGTVSPTGFRNPSKVVNNLIIIDNDTFWVLWLELYSMSRYSRVKDHLPALDNS